jgi:hypothetical protein
MDPELVEDGRLCIPLYHGTSSLFESSIRAYGLGALNPLDRYEAQSFLRAVYTLCEEAFESDAEWQSCKFAAKWIANQESFSDSSNFQHGQTYLTPSRSSAVGYALTNRLGSEFLSQAFRMYRLLQERAALLLERSSLVKHPFVSVFGVEHVPVLITVKDVPVSSIASEGGDSAEASLEQLRQFKQFLDLPGIPLNINFRLIRTILPDSCSIERLDPRVERNPYDW